MSNNSNNSECGCLVTKSLKVKIKSTFVESSSPVPINTVTDQNAQVTEAKFEVKRSLSDLISTSDIPKPDSNKFKNHRENSINMTRNDIFITCPIRESSMSRIDPSAKKLAYENLKNWTPCPKICSLKSNVNYVNNGIKSTSATNEDTEKKKDTDINTICSIIASEKNNQMLYSNSNKVSYERFPDISNTTEDMSKKKKIEASKDVPCNGLNSLSPTESNLRSFFAALSSVAKKDVKSKSPSVNLKQNKFTTSENMLDVSVLSNYDVHSSDRLSSNERQTSPQHKLLSSPTRPVINRSPTSRKGLTLSAFRRPEVSVRLTDCPLNSYIHQSYHISRILGHGESSIVRLAFRRRDNKRFAVKCIPKHILLSQKHRLEEVALLKAIHHPQIVSLVDVFETENEVQLVMEYCPGGELFDAVQGKLNEVEVKRGTETRDRKCHGAYSEKQAAKIISSLLKALSYLHFLGIVHRDVKPENILLMSTKDGETEVKLSDFGTARVLRPQGLPILMTPSRFGPFLPNEGEYHSRDAPHVERHERRLRAYSCVGSDFYTAPEVHSGKGYDTSADLYSLGVTMYILLFGKFPTTPFDASSTNEKHWKQISPEARCLLQLLLHPDPNRRIKAVEALKHHWIVNNNFEDKKRSLKGFACDNEGWRTKKPRLIDIVDMELSIFEEPNLFHDECGLIIDNSHEEESSRSIPLRPTCFV